MNFRKVTFKGTVEVGQDESQKTNWKAIAMFVEGNG